MKRQIRHPRAPVALKKLGSRLESNSEGVLSQNVVETPNLSFFLSFFLFPPSFLLSPDFFVPVPPAPPRSLICIKLSSLKRSGDGRGRVVRRMGTDGRRDESLYSGSAHAEEEEGCSRVRVSWEQ